MKDEYFAEHENKICFEMYGEDQLMDLADEMAAAATTFRGQGYQAFISSREQFKQALHETLVRLSK